MCRLWGVKCSRHGPRRMSWTRSISMSRISKSLTIIRLVDRKKLRKMDLSVTMTRISTTKVSNLSSDCLNRWKNLSHFRSNWMSLWRKMCSCANLCRTANKCSRQRKKSMNSRCKKKRNGFRSRKNLTAHACVGWHRKSRPSWSQHRLSYLLESDGSPHKLIDRIKSKDIQILPWLKMSTASSSLDIEEYRRYWFILTLLSL